MKILFIADHHIKLGQKNVPKDWARARFWDMWVKVTGLAIEYNVTTIIHGGDIFDSVPSMEELAVYGEMLDLLCQFTNIIYPGNHEAVKKHTSFLEHLRTMSNATIVDEFMGEEEVKIAFGIPNSSILPYTDLKKKTWHKERGKILFTHVRGAIEPHVEPEIDLNLLSNWETVYAGDLHSHKMSQRNIVYPGSPAATTFKRELSKNSHGILVVDTENNSWEFIDLEMPQLLKRTVYKESDVVKTTPHHTSYELVGAECSMSKVEDVELVSSKLANTEVEHHEIELSSTSVEDELSEYFIAKEGIEDTSKYVTLFKEIV